MTDIDKLIEELIRRLRGRPIQADTGSRDGGAEVRQPGERPVPAQGFQEVRCRPSRGTIAPRRRGAPSRLRLRAGFR